MPIPARGSKDTIEASLDDMDVVIAAKTDPLAMERLLIENENFILAVLKRAGANGRTNGAPYLHDRDDLHQEACIGLIKAVRAYDPESGIRFIAFAYPTVMGYVRKAMRQGAFGVSLSAAQTEAMFTVRRHRMKHPEVTLAEIVDGHPKMSPTALERAFNYQEGPLTRSIQAPVGQALDGEEITLEQVLAAPGIPLEEQVLEQVSSEEWERAVGRLPARTQKALEWLRQGLGENAIAQRMGLRRSRVSQIVLRAAMTLSARLGRGR